MFGGFILHFLLCNWLTVLLRPSYEEPVETTQDVIERNITPFYAPGSQIMKQIFAASPDPIYHEISKRLVIAKDWDEFDDMMGKVISTGVYAFPHTLPWRVPEEEFKDWYRSTETIPGMNPYAVHLSNKKWPLKKVLILYTGKFKTLYFQKYDLNILRFTQVRKIINNIFNI